MVSLHQTTRLLEAGMRSQTDLAWPVSGGLDLLHRSGDGSTSVVRISCVPRRAQDGLVGSTGASEEALARLM
jgi:hypothetical protein